jgi:AcrR family transcriptional regulator
VPKIDHNTRAARRRDLIDAAWRCIARSGWHALTIDDVCAEAGVSKGAFYGYFKRKQDLLLALLSEQASQLDALLADPSGRTLTTAERLRSFTRAMLQQAADPAHVQLRADLWATLATEPTVRDHFAATVARRRAALRALIEHGVEAGELAAVPANALASVLLALSDGLVLHGGLEPTAFKWTNIYRAVDAVLDGLRALDGPVVRQLPE